MQIIIYIDKKFADKTKNICTCVFVRTFSFALHYFKRFLLGFLYECGQTGTK